eukprot:s1449_g11.t4
MNDFHIRPSVVLLNYVAQVLFEDLSVLPGLASLVDYFYNATVTCVREARDQGRQLRPDVFTYNLILRALEEQDAQWILALEVLSQVEAKSLQLDVISYVSAISVCERTGQANMALRLLTEMRARRLQSIIALNAAISACGRGEQWQQALILFSGAEHQQLAVDVVTCGAAVSACEKAGQWVQALQLLSSAHAGRLRINVVALSAGISACEKAVRWEEALWLLFDLEVWQLEADVTSYSAAISACEKAAEWRRALQLLSQAEDQGLQVNLITLSAGLMLEKLWAHGCLHFS